MLKSYSRLVSVVLILWRVDPVIRNGCGVGMKVRDTKFVALVQRSEISLGDTPGI